MFRMIVIVSPKINLYFIEINMKVKTKTDQNQIVILTNADDEKQKLPMNLILTLAAGTIAGMVIIFGLFMGAEKLMGL